MKSVAIFLAYGYEEVEAITTVDILRRAGIKVDMISVSGEKNVIGRTGITVVSDIVGVLNGANNYDGIILPGGMPGTTNLMQNEDLCRLILDFNKNNKMLASICAAPSVFGKLDILRGKNACCYPGMEGELTGAKANVLKVNVDGHIITSRGIGTAIEFSLAIVEYLINKEMADEISRSIVYNM